MNSKKLWKDSPAARVPTAFLVLPNLHSCFYNSIETRKMFSTSQIWVGERIVHPISCVLPFCNNELNKEKNRDLIDSKGDERSGDSEKTTVIT